jgi:hypothetical protein
MNDKIGVVVWISLALQVLIILGGFFTFIYALPSKGYIDSKIENLKADIKELQDDVDQLNQNYIDHLAYHVDKP